jgi:hypothetical protein
MNFKEFFNLFLKYAIFGAVIYLVVYKVPTNAVSSRDDLVITLISVAAFILLEMFGGYIKKLKEWICGCGSSSGSSIFDDSSSLDQSLVI